MNEQVITICSQCGWKEDPDNLHRGTKCPECGAYLWDFEVLRNEDSDS